MLYKSQSIVSRQQTQKSFGYMSSHFNNRFNHFGSSDRMCAQDSRVTLLVD
jgi:hypothetical protein